MIIYIAAWLLSGFVLGYIHSVCLNKSTMTIEDVLLNTLAGPIMLTGFYIHFRKHVIITGPKREIVTPDIPRETLQRTKPGQGDNKP